MHSTLSWHQVASASAVKTEENTCPTSVVNSGASWAGDGESSDGVITGKRSPRNWPGTAIQIPTEKRVNVGHSSLPPTNSGHTLHTCHVCGRDSQRAAYAHLDSTGGNARAWPFKNRLSDSPGLTLASSGRSPGQGLPRRTFLLWACSKTRRQRWLAGKDEGKQISSNLIPVTLLIL